MLSRSLRAETRNRSKEEVKRVINTIERVRKWEKKWVLLKDSTVRVFKWVPVSESQRFGSNVRPQNAESVPVKRPRQFLQENSELQSEAEECTDSMMKSMSDFAEVNEDSNAFSEGCFNSDSNQAMSNSLASSAVETGVTDFREIVESEKKKALENNEDTNKAVEANEK